MINRYFFAAMVLLVPSLLGGATTGVTESQTEEPKQAVSFAAGDSDSRKTQVYTNNISFTGDENYFNSGTQVMSSGQSITVEGYISFSGGTEEDYSKARLVFSNVSDGLKITDYDYISIKEGKAYFKFTVKLTGTEKGSYLFNIGVEPLSEDGTVEYTAYSQTQTVILEETTGSSSTDSSSSSTSTTETSSTDSSSSSTSTTETSSTDASSSSTSTTETSSTDSSSSSTSTTETSSTDSSSSSTSTTETSSTDSSSSSTSTTETSSTDSSSSSTSTTETSSTESSSTQSSSTNQSTSETRVGVPLTGQTPPAGKDLPQTGEEIFFNKLLITVGVVLMGLTTGLLIHFNKKREE